MKLVILLDVTGPSSCLCFVFCFVFFFTYNLQRFPHEINCNMQKKNMKKKQQPKITLQCILKAPASQNTGNSPIQQLHIVGCHSVMSITRSRCKSRSKCTFSIRQYYIDQQRAIYIRKVATPNEKFLSISSAKSLNTIAEATTVKHAFLQRYSRFGGNSTGTCRLRNAFNFFTLSLCFSVIIKKKSFCALRLCI